MIRSFRNDEARKVFQRQRSRRVPEDLQRIALRKLTMLDAVESIEDLRTPPGNRLKRLSRERKGQYSIRINDQWRICFTWRDGDAYEVELVDYH